MFRLCVCLCVALFANAGLVMQKDRYAGMYEDYDGREMAPYKVDPSSKGKPYEKRIYPALKWVNTDVASISMDFAGFMTFPRLFKYISGANEKKQKMNMTVPVVMKVDARAPRSWRIHNYEMSFYIPSAFQKNPPKPKSLDVYIESAKTMIVYANTFSGFSYSWKNVAEYEALKDWLRKDNVTFECCHFYVAGYNSPLEYKNRRNEVWLIGK